ncbi:MAG: hypothetical protein GQF41_2012 [Candidatus Rifleibacterium amylolyticum]|nr:MAG: hypothetical protein GQF41_2012 [Candidatus Rifleibacterium amylolyticum]
MTKTITIRLDDKIYELIKTAAQGELRTISNFIEYAALKYLTDENSVSDLELQEILSDENLLKSFENAEADIKKGRYKIV